MPQFGLKQFEKPGGVRAVHLRVVKLEGYCECCPEQSPPIPSPYHERIIEYAAIHSYGSKHPYPPPGNFFNKL